MASVGVAAPDTGLARALGAISALLRILIAAYFMARGLAQIIEPSDGARFGAVVAQDHSALVTMAYLLFVSMLIFTGKGLRPAAMMLGVYILWSGFVHFLFGNGATADPAAADVYWRDMAILAVLFLIALFEPVERKRTPPHDIDADGPARVRPAAPAAGPVPPHSRRLPAEEAERARNAVLSGEVLAPDSQDAAPAARAAAPRTPVFSGWAESACQTRLREAARAVRDDTAPEPEPETSDPRATAEPAAPEPPETETENETALTGELLAPEPQETAMPRPGTIDRDALALIREAVLADTAEPPARDAQMRPAEAPDDPANAPDNPWAGAADFDLHETIEEGIREAVLSGELPVRRGGPKPDAAEPRDRAEVPAPDPAEPIDPRIARLKAETSAYALLAGMLEAPAAPGTDAVADDLPATTEVPDADEAPGEHDAPAAEPAPEPEPEPEPVPEPVFVHRTEPPALDLPPDTLERIRSAARARGVPMQDPVAPGRAGRHGDDARTRILGAARQRPRPAQPESQDDEIINIFAEAWEDGHRAAP